MPSGDERISDEEGTLRDYEKTPGAPDAVAVPEDPAAPSKLVSSKKQRLSDIFTIVSFNARILFVSQSTGLI